MVRIYLSGSLTLEANENRLGPQDFPGNQGRAAFAFLVGQHHAPVPRSALADAVWPRAAPPSQTAALNSIVSKLRALLTRAGLDGATTLRSDGGCFEMHLPRGTWIDHEAAADSIHEAESALQRGNPARAYGPSAVAHHIARRPFLPDAEGHWFEHRRDKLASILIRALECRAEVYLWNREHALAVEAARDAVALRPFRESAYRLLMRAHMQSGNAAEALLVYERCRGLISDELGASPSPETQAAHMAILQSL